ncbi:Auxin-responsive protein IAA15 [Dichanthelium oligosanthes]|uniref:Auxin-responsive protein n=1 Tax=Dichanthelium oligosanthes TaxID=888268 RepID=A0A1E5V1T4_9POAL|nr:Auxin-responsive protein IAA15 [Dichanthelium oligosanthes]
MSEGPARSSTESSSAASSGLDFEETALTLRLPGSDPDRKRAASTSDPADSGSRSPRASDAPPSPKARVVGWPPVSRNRRNALPRGKFVKVAVAGAPYQRKVDLEAYAGYEQLLAALQDKFTAHFTVRRGANEEMELIDVVSGAEYVPTYEDKDGDWMLVGDVPWRSVLMRAPSSLLLHPPRQLMFAQINSCLSSSRQLIIRSMDCFTVG